jgi:hypothetical protein
METAVLISVLLAAGLLMASSVWVGSVLIRTILRIKRPAASTAHSAADGAGGSHPDSAQS